jgi:hypothetical protein
MTPHDQETRIKRAAAELEGLVPLFLKSTRDWSAVARKVLKAADREPWPTDESVDAHRAVEPALTDHVPYEVTRARLRAALLADPIIQAALIYTAGTACERRTRGDAVMAAVREAGL